MNNEPVAYVDNVWINRPDLAMDLGIGQMFSRCQLSDHQIPLYTHQYERPHNTVLVPCDKLAEMQAEILAGKIMIKGYSKTIDEQQAEIEALKDMLEEEGIGVSQKYLNERIAKLRKAQEK